METKYLFISHSAELWHSASQALPSGLISSLTSLKKAGGFTLVLFIRGVVANNTTTVMHPVLQSVLKTEGVEFLEIRTIESDFTLDLLNEALRPYRLQSPLSADCVWVSDSELEKALVESTGLSYYAEATSSWSKIKSELLSKPRRILHRRSTAETKIEIDLTLEGSGVSDIQTGLGFFDHMLDQLARHGGLDLQIRVAGDLHIDEHHTVEDTALALGEAFRKAVANKVGMFRYGFNLPMDDCLAQVAIDFGGRPWIVWKVDFNRECIGDVPTELFFHFFKSFSDTAACNLNIQCSGENEHHKIEAIFKAWARAIRMAVKRDIEDERLPSTKELL